MNADVCAYRHPWHDSTEVPGIKTAPEGAANSLGREGEKAEGTRPYMLRRYWPPTS